MHVYELLETVAVCARPAKFKPELVPALRRGNGHRLTLLRIYLQLILTGKGNISFLP